MRVKLFFTQSRSAKLDEKVKGIDFIRLRASVRFKTATGWSDIYDAIVDTGAPISLIPLSIWKEATCTKLADHEVRGVVPKPECALPVKIGTLQIRLLDDEGHRTGPLEIHAYLVSTDEVSLILGFKDLLAEFGHHFDYRTDTAYIDTRKLKT